MQIRVDAVRFNQRNGESHVGTAFCAGIVEIDEASVLDHVGIHYIQNGDTVRVFVSAFELSLESYLRVCAAAEIKAFA